MDCHLLPYKGSQAKKGPRVLLPVLPLSTYSANVVNKVRDSLRDQETVRHFVPPILYMQLVVSPGGKLLKKLALLPVTDVPSVPLNLHPNGNECFRPEDCHPSILSVLK